MRYFKIIFYGFGGASIKGWIWVSAISHSKKVVGYLKKLLVSSNFPGNTDYSRDFSRCDTS